MYTTKNFKTKKQLKEAVAAGQIVTIYAPAIGSPKTDGWETVEGPHGGGHTWYAEVFMVGGNVTKVK